MAARDVLKRVPAAYWLARRARMAAGEVLPARRLAEVPGPVHRNDVMFTAATSAAEYRDTGRAAAAFVAEAIAREGRTPRNGLDLGSGHGRVLRHLVELVPAAWTACDIDGSAVRFCARAFGATPVRARSPLRAVAFPTAPYDVVWMGSLVTHLDLGALDDLWQALAAITSPGAVVALSILPPPVVVHLEMFGPGLGRHAPEVAQRLERDGVAYIAYPHYAKGDYGVTFHDPDRLVAQVSRASGRPAALEAHAPGAWLGMQDYVAFSLR